MNAGLDLLVEMILCEVSGVGTSASAVVGGRYGGLWTVVDTIEEEECMVLCTAELASVEN
jgi:hypothetical protein